MLFTETAARFHPGRLVATSALLESVPREELFAAYARHLNCDWGDVSESDKRANECALRFGDRIVSAYHSKAGEEFFIITEADRSSTTLLRSDEY